MSVLPRLYPSASHVSRSLRGALGVGCALMLAAACGGGDDERSIRAAQLAEGCVLSSDCANDLICAFQRCHVECNTSRDCQQSGGSELRCMLSEKPVHVCQLEDERKCSYNSECPGEQVCATDGECRDACRADSDCITEQLCVSGTCAEPNELDPDGNLPADPNVAPGGVTCSYTSECPSPQSCRGGICAAECLTTRDCQAGFACTEQVCVPQGSGGSGGVGGNAGAGGSGAGGSGAGGTGAGGSGGSAGSGATAGVAALRAAALLVARPAPGLAPTGCAMAWRRQQTAAAVCASRAT